MHIGTDKVKYVLSDGEPCQHVGCAHHISHPCEGCGRIGAQGTAVMTDWNRLSLRHSALRHRNRRRRRKHLQHKCR